MLGLFILESSGICIPISVRTQSRATDNFPIIIGLHKGSTLSLAFLL